MGDIGTVIQIIVIVLGFIGACAIWEGVRESQGRRK